MNSVKEHSAGFILFCETKGKREYLILHYTSGHFEFPKGHIEKQETEMEAARRELMEETGIRDIEIIGGYKEKIEYFIHKEGRMVPKDAVFFLAKTDQKDVNLSHEHQNAMWLTYYAADKKITHGNARALLEKAEKFLNKNNS